MSILFVFGSSAETSKLWPFHCNHRPIVECMYVNDFLFKGEYKSVLFSTEVLYGHQIRPESPIFTFIYVHLLVLVVISVHWQMLCHY